MDLLSLRLAGWLAGWLGTVTASDEQCVLRSPLLALCHLLLLLLLLFLIPYFLAINFTTV